MTRPGIHKSLEVMQDLCVSVMPAKHIFCENIHPMHAQTQLQLTVHKLGMQLAPINAHVMQCSHQKFVYIMRFMLVSNLVMPCISSGCNQHAEAGKGHFVLLYQTTKGTLEPQRAQCPLVEA